ARQVLFFFQAEDGIRDFHVTGVQTCALPICSSWLYRRRQLRVYEFLHSLGQKRTSSAGFFAPPRSLLGATEKSPFFTQTLWPARSEERRVGKESRSPRWG